MNPSNGMGQQRPPYDQRSPSTSNSVPPSQPLHAQTNMSFSPGSHFSPSMPYSQMPGNKRARMSPGAQPPYPSNPSPIPVPHYGNQINGINGHNFSLSQPPPARSGVMGPPSLPVTKATDIDRLQDSLAGTGVNIEEEDRHLTNSEYYSHPLPNPSFSSQHANFGPYLNNVYDRPGAAGGSSEYTGRSVGQQEVKAEVEISPEEAQRRRDVRADWEAAKHQQHPLWEMFLLGETLNNRLAQKCYSHGMKPPQIGYYVSQKTGQPQATRVNGLDGASRVIDRGQPILKTGEGEALGDILKVLCLAAKERLIGVVDTSARLAYERKQHSKGRVPTEWQSVAAAVSPSPGAAMDGGTPSANPSLKRTFSEANGDGTAERTTRAGPLRIGEVFRKISEADHAAEQARLAKRAKRRQSHNPESGDTAGASTPGAPETPTAASQDVDRKYTKKDRKLLESKFTEAQQHKSANETARMATLGSLGKALGAGKKGKTYSWLSGAPGPASSPGPAAIKPNPNSNASSAAGTPRAERVAMAPKTKLFGQWEEDKEPDIQARDVVLVLESDGKAPRSLARAYNIPQG